MLEMVPRNLFSNDYVVRLPEHAATVLDISNWRERGEFELDGAHYRLYREGRMSGAFILERDGAIIARATKPSVLRPRFDLELGGRPLILRRLSAFSRRFGVFAGDVQIGTIGRAGFVTRRANLDLPGDWPVAVQLFVFWLVLVIWRREAAAAAS
jgi:hypothetical protein